MIAEPGEAKDGSDHGTTEPREEHEDAPAKVVPDFEPVFRDPGAPKVDASNGLVAPEELEHILIRAGLPVGKRYANLRYEGNNRNFRGPTVEGGLYRDGAATAADWRRYAAGVRALIVLRDSLFSQQDHPVLQQPHALMMPPSWVSVAVARAMSGEALTAPATHDVGDDEAWATEADTGSMFGSFPVSARLRDEAARPLAGSEPDEVARSRNARRSIAALSQSAHAMVSATPNGAEAVAAAGAAVIAGSDRSYFGAEIRRDRIIPIFVENPNEHELRDEGKGMAVWGLDLPTEAIARARQAVYSRRLLDGALGIERYDLRDAEQRRRAIAVLEPLIPRGSKGHAVWLWVNGGSDGHGNGDPATPYIADFHSELADANIEPTRLVLLSKPSVRPRGPDARAELYAAAKAHRDLQIPLSVQLNTRGLQKLLDPP